MVKGREPWESREGVTGREWTLASPLLRGLRRDGPKLGALEEVSKPGGGTGHLPPCDFTSPGHFLSCAAGGAAMALTPSVAQTKWGDEGKG